MGYPVNRLFFSIKRQPRFRRFIMTPNYQLPPFDTIVAVVLVVILTV